MAEFVYNRSFCIGEIVIIAATGLQGTITDMRWTPDFEEYFYVNDNWYSSKELILIENKEVK